MPGRYALIVATDAYEDEKLRRLRAPAHDADALARVLRDPEVGGFEVELLANQPEARLRRRIAGFFADRGREDLLLLHFSCHGLKDDSGQLYFAAADTEVAQLDASAVPAEFVSRQMARSRSNSVLMLLDCCYSGAIARGLTFRAGDGVDVSDHLGGHGRAVITASSAMEYAFEGDALTGEGRPSVFTSAVVKALETGEADRDQDRWISVRELYDYVCDEVRELTPHQRPNMLSHLEGELYIARSCYVAEVKLPAELLDALANPLSAVRTGAVSALAELLESQHQGLAAAARARLERVVVEDDSRRVSAAAEVALAGAPEEPTVAAPPLAHAVSSAAAAPPAVAAPPRTATSSSPVTTISPPAAAGSPPPRAVSLTPAAVRSLWPLGLTAAGAVVVWIGWTIPWVYDSDGRDITTESNLPQLWWLVAAAAAGLVAAGLSLARRAPWWGWWAVLLAASCGLGLVAHFADLAWSNVWRAGGLVTTAGLLALAASAAVMALRAPPSAREAAPAWLGDALALAGALVATSILRAGDWPESEAYLRTLLIWLTLAAAVAAIARLLRARVVPARAAAAVIAAVGAADAGFAAGVTRWGLIPAALAMAAGGVYAATTRR
ncbi:caspase family protein [Candidatus Solirubrobacter pratensis]|uniref:caspase family protein n=1 Tax=Candidatus Solirubrobacter pratensis TaxID=1298857 RepID=UPI00040FAF54|nr:caspase family protein [Candidatus Solirubrobacter pratensis]